MDTLSHPDYQIDGLEWLDLWNISNGTDSHIVPIPSLRPSNIVFKGDGEFSYGHYGVHLGQTDRLIFLGSKSHAVKAYFIDCRESSKTFKRRLSTEFYPSSKRLLVIPPGVAHAFDTKATFTLNLYSMLLPAPSEWLSPDCQWTVKGDIINVKMDVSDNEIPHLKENSLKASEVFYKLIAEEQRNSLETLKHEYPSTEDIKFKDGSNHRLKFWKRLEQEQTRQEWLPYTEITGAGWKKNLVVWTGQISGYVPLLDRRPKHLIDHGETYYTHDAYGIHLGGDDHLIFIGPSDRQAVCEMVDCRSNSPTLHQTIKFSFKPDPLSTLIIPRGVAHRFENLEGIFTINQPLTFLPDDENTYEPGNDVIDWPLKNRPFPILNSNHSEAETEFYESLSAKQIEMISTPPTHATPSILMASREDGTPVKVAFRKRLS